MATLTGRILGMYDEHELHHQQTLRYAERFKRFRAREDDNRRQNLIGVSVSLFVLIVVKFLIDPSPFFASHWVTTTEQLAAGGIALAVTYMILFGIKLALLAAFDYRLRIFPIDQLRPALFAGIRREDEEIEGEPAKDQFSKKRG